LDSFGLTSEITGKHSEQFLKNAKNKNLLKSKEYCIPAYKLTGGPIFYI